MNHFRANAKFLITAEYLILSGARGMALPLPKYFQQLKITPSESNCFSWRALDEKNGIWIEASFCFENLKLLQGSESSLTERLAEILHHLKELKPHLFNSPLHFETSMNFSRHWGLGSSSTLISLLAQWSGVDAFYLQKKFFNGSGFDIACATSSTPLLFELQDDVPKITPVIWSPSFSKQLYFIYLKKKQDSAKAVANFQKQRPDVTLQEIELCNSLTKKFLTATNLSEFKTCLIEHERLVAAVTGLSPVKQLHFSDFSGEIKSLGAWGGDFALVASEEDPREYFAKKGYTQLMNWNDFIN